MYIVYVQQHYFGGRQKKRAHGDLVEAVEKKSDVTAASASIEVGSIHFLQAPYPRPAIIKM